MFKQVMFALVCLAVAVSAGFTIENVESAKKAVTTAIDVDNRCTTSDDCDTVAIGARACGGPSSYAVYSKKSSNVGVIRSLAQRTTLIERQYNAEHSVISICSLAMPPQVACDQNNKCVAKSNSSPFEPISIQ